MAVTEHKVVYGRTVGQLNSELSSAISAGFQPMGGAFYAPDVPGAVASGFYCNVIKGKLDGSLNDLIAQIEGISDAVDAIDARVDALEGPPPGDV